MKQRSAVIDDLNTLFAVLAVSFVCRHRDCLSSMRPRIQVLAGYGRPVDACLDEAIAANTGEPKPPLRVRRHSRRESNQVPREVSILQLKTQPFLALSRFKPGAKVFSSAALISITRRVMPLIDLPSRSTI